MTQEELIEQIVEEGRKNYDGPDGMTLKELKELWKNEIEERMLEDSKICEANEEFLHRRKVLERDLTLEAAKDFASIAIELSSKERWWAFWRGYKLAEGMFS